MARLTDAEEPAAHIEVIESSDAEYAAVTAHAAAYRRRQLAKRVVAVALFVPYVGLVFALASKDDGWRFAVVAAVVLFAVSLILWAINNETLKAARRGIWSKSCSVVVEAEGAASTTPAYLVLRRSGVYVQAISTEKWRAQFRTVHSFPWPALNTVEFTPKGNRWRSVVISGPGVRIAPIGSVNAGFADALRELGAEPSE
ncbi:MAG: hypothetical protein GY720_04170 [bacterium]|nr:hypothetical protein [bacterium]